MVAYDYPSWLWTLTLNLTIPFHEQYKFVANKYLLLVCAIPKSLLRDVARCKVEAEIDRPCKIATRHFRSSRLGREHAHALPSAGAPRDPQGLSQTDKFTFTRLLFAQRLS